MQETPCWSEGQATLHSGRGRFDPWTLEWRAEPMPADDRPLRPDEALRRLAARGGLRRVPVGVIGPRAAATDELATAERLGAAIAGHGLQLLCGGRGGVMEAACRGCAGAGGEPIGILPDTDWREANPYVAIPIATGIGEARNAIIARACPVLVAVGGSYGTLSEIALGLHFGRLVLSLGAPPPMDGPVACASVEEVLERTAERILGLG